MGYAKLFSSITESSLWCEPKEVRLLFVSMLAKADASGFVEAALPGLARLANLTLSEVEIAVEILESPDRNSKNPDNEGRRLLRVPGGWMLLNYEGYRSRRGDEDRREYMRDYMKNYREKQGKVRKRKRVNNVNTCKPPLTGVSHAASASASASVFTRNKEGEAVKLPFTSERFTKAWGDWVKHRCEIKKPLKETSIKMQLAKITAIGEERAIAMIEHTIFKGWEGLREEEPERFKKQRIGPGQTYDPDASKKDPNHGRM